MELRLFLSNLARGWYILLAAALFGLLAGLLHAATTQPLYVSNAQLLVNVRSAASINDLAQANSLSQQLAANYAQLAGTRYVLDRAAKQADVGVTAVELGGEVTAVAVENTAFVNITAQADSARAAARIADAVSSSLIVASRTLAQDNSSANSTLELEAVQPANTPLLPSGGSLASELPLGGAIGLLVGVVIVLLRERFDTRFRSANRVAVVTNADVLGAMPNDRTAKTVPALALPAKSPARYETFRSLRTALDGQGMLPSDGGIIAVTSSVPGEGKSSTVAGLAVAIAATGRDVVVVEADLRRPTVSKAFGVDFGPGLTDVLLGKETADTVLQQVGPDDHIKVLRAGSAVLSSSELFETEALATLLDELKQGSTTVLVDTPPLLALSDAASLARHADRVVLVVGATVAKEGEVERALAVLRRVKVAVSGVVVNRVPRFWPDSGVGDYSAYKEVGGSDLGR